MYQEQIHAYFEAREEELIEAVSRLVRIRSVAGEATPAMPFGEGPAAALDEALSMARALGFETENVDGYVGTVDFGKQETLLHILAHLDVVGEGTGWTVTEPYQPKLVDGLLYGRGTDDDKGPAVAALLAMKAVRDLNIPLKHNVRLILGTDEESGSADIAYYYSRNPHAPYSFTPDAGFPVINVEKGSYKPVFGARWADGSALPRVRSAEGGFRVNVIPPDAAALVEGMSQAELEPFCRDAARETGARFDLTDEGGAVRVSVAGTGGHAAYPEESNNALTALLHLLATLPLAPGAQREALCALGRLFPHGDSAGRALGVAQADEVSGPLTLVLSLFNLDEGGFTARFDSRVPVRANDENCRAVVEAALAAHGFSVLEHHEMGAAHHTPADTPFVQTLLRCYEQYTGQKGEANFTGGGTYVHNVPGGVAFGCTMPGFESNLHGPDERVRVSDLLTACKIFTQVIIDLCG